jgi:hypothetical protein
MVTLSSKSKYYSFETSGCGNPSLLLFLAAYRTRIYNISLPYSINPIWSIIITPQFTKEKEIKANQLIL